MSGFKVTRFGPSIPYLGDGRIGYDPGTPVGATPPPENIAEDGTAFVPIASGTPAFVQGKTAAGDGGTTVATFDAAPTINNLIVVVHCLRSGGDAATLSGFNKVDNARGADIFGQRSGITMWWKIAGEGESATITVTKNNASGGRIWIAEFSGAGVLADDTKLENQSSASTLSIGPLTPSSESLLVAAFLQDWGDASGVSYTPGTGWTEGYDEYTEGTFGPRSTGIYRFASGSQSASTTSTRSDTWAAVYAEFASGETIWGLAPETVDGDDDTCRTSSGTEAWRMWIGAPVRIASARIVIGPETSGSKTYALEGSNDPEFATSTELYSWTFTATGSFTKHTLTGQWLGDNGYEYVRIVGPDESRAICTVELFEAVTDLSGYQLRSEKGQPDGYAGLDSAGLIDPTDLGTGSDGSGDHILLDDQTWVDKDSLGGPDTSLVTVAATGATETVDVSVARTYDLTLDANCTLTLSGATTAEAHYVTLLLRQDGTGGRTVTWPGSVVWPDGVTPTLSTAANAVDVFALFTLDGGTTWFGFPTGGGGAAIGDTVESETTFGITPAAGVATTASASDHTHGSPANPVTEAAIRDAGRWEVVVSGSAPPVAVTNEAQDDWIYGWVSE